MKGGGDVKMVGGWDNAVNENLVVGVGVTGDHAEQAHFPEQQT